MAKKNNVQPKAQTKTAVKVTSKVTAKSENLSKGGAKSKLIKENTAKVQKQKVQAPEKQKVTESKVETVASKRKAKLKEQSNVRAKKAAPKVAQNNNISAPTTSPKLSKKASKKDSSNIELTKKTSKIEKEEEPKKEATVTEDGKEILDISKFLVKSEMPTGSKDEVILKCVKQGSKLRVRIVTKGYYNDANCQFPKDIRKEGRMYKVNVRNVILASGSSGRYFYRVNSGVTVLDDKEVTVTSIVVFEDKTDTDCAVCLCVPKTTVIVPCGHFYTCMACAQKLDKCPICRGDIQKLIDKTKMD